MIIYALFLSLRDEIFKSFMQVTHSILLARANVGHVTLLCTIFIFMFAIAGVQLFGGRFGYCEVWMDIHQCVERNKIFSLI